MTLTTAPTTATNRITGSDSMKTGMVPAVSVTIVDANKTRQIPDVRITRPVCNLGFFRAITDAITQIEIPISKYKSNILRGMVPPALP